MFFSTFFPCFYLLLFGIPPYGTTMVIKFVILHEPNKCTLVAWVDKVLNQTLFKKNIMKEFKATRIWPFNPKAMDHKPRPSDV
jgi:hypothetical protein